MSVALALPVRLKLEDTRNSAQAKPVAHVKKCNIAFFHGVPTRRQNVVTNGTGEIRTGESRPFFVLAMGILQRWRHPQEPTFVHRPLRYHAAE
jgi:hypothetical protein